MCLNEATHTDIFETLFEIYLANKFRETKRVVLCVVIVSSFYDRLQRSSQRKNLCII